MMDDIVRSLRFTIVPDKTILSLISLSLMVLSVYNNRQPNLT